MKTATHYYTRDRVFRFIQQYCAEQGRAPSYQDIAIGVGTSRANVSYHVRMLESAGRLVRQPTPRRSSATIRGELLDPSLVSVALQRAILLSTETEARQSLTPILDTLVVPLPPGTWMPRRQQRRRRSA